MKQARFTESRIVAIPEKADAGMKINAVCGKHGRSDATCYNWKAKHDEMDGLHCIQ